MTTTLTAEDTPRAVVAQRFLPPDAADGPSTPFHVAFTVRRLVLDLSKAPVRGGVIDWSTLAITTRTSARDDHRARPGLMLTAQAAVIGGRPS